MTVPQGFLPSQGPCLHSGSSLPVFSIHHFLLSPFYLSHFFLALKCSCSRLLCISFILVLISGMVFLFSFSREGCHLIQTSYSDLRCLFVLYTFLWLFISLFWNSRLLVGLSGDISFCCLFLALRTHQRPLQALSPTLGRALQVQVLNSRCVPCFLTLFLAALLRLSCLQVCHMSLCLLLPSPAEMLIPQRTCGSCEFVLWGSPDFIINFSHGALVFLSSCLICFYMGM